MKVGILNSGGYNLNSVIFALNRIGIDDIIVVNTHQEFDMCNKVIMPGVGHARTAMNLLSKQGLIECLRSTTKPVLGICLGMQIMCAFSQEGSTDCIGIFNENVVKLPTNVIVPQMGWNRLINGQYGEEFVYFANSYYVPICDDTISYVEYSGIKISAMIQKNNFLGCQFHPEKSGVIGSSILSDFISL